jgi:hypothetical protein
VEPPLQVAPVDVWHVAGLEHALAQQMPLTQWPFWQSPFEPQVAPSATPHPLAPAAHVQLVPLPV